MIPVFIAADNITTSLGFTTKENIECLQTGTIGLMRIADTGLSATPIFASRIDNIMLEKKSATLAHPSLYTRLEKLAILSITDALDNTNIDIRSKDTGFILSTTKGNIDVLQNEQMKMFGKQRLYLWESARMIKEHFKMQNTPMVISNACVSGVLAIIMGSRMIRSGQYKQVVITGIDILSDFVISGFQSFQALSNEPCRPFDKHRSGLSLGEGCGTIIITSNGNALQGTNPICVGNGSSGNDANHISGPSRTGEGLYVSIKQVLENKGTAHSIDYISAHGTATPYNDEMESIALTRAGLENVPLNSFKGYWGHTLGAAGVIESIAATYSLKHNILFQSAGFTESGVSHPLNIITQTKAKNLNSCLKIASGFGGCNTAVHFYKA